MAGLTSHALEREYLSWERKLSNKRKAESMGVARHAHSYQLPGTKSDGRNNITHSSMTSKKKLVRKNERERENSSSGMERVRRLKLVL
jgi:hypothetical protein